LLFLSFFIGVFIIIITDCRNAEVLAKTEGKEEPATTTTAPTPTQTSMTTAKEVTKAHTTKTTHKGSRENRVLCNYEKKKKRKVSFCKVK
jgi:hypothetical protein